MQVNTNDVVAQAVNQIQGMPQADQSQEQQVEQENTASNEQVEQKTENDSFSSRFESLVKKEKQLLAEKKKYQDEMKALEEKRAKYKDIEDFDNLLMSNPLEALKRKGLSLDHLNEYAIKNLKDEDLDPIQLKIKEMEEKIANSEKNALEALQKQMEEKERAQAEEERNKLVEEYKANLTDFVQTNKEKYELVSMTDGAEEQLYEIAAAVYEQTQKVLSPEECCELLENHLVENLKKILQLNKVKQLLGSDSEDDLLALATKKAHESGTFKTLTDDYAPATKAASDKPMNDSERLARAIEAVKGMI